MFDEGKSSTGFEENVVAAASYLGFLSLLILILEKRSNFVRFHAVQSGLGFGLLAIFWLAVKWIGALWFLIWAPGLLAFIYVVFMMIKAYDGEEYKLPVIGNLAFSAIYDTEPEPEDTPPAESSDRQNNHTAEGA